jgi:hypothetical protein
MTLLNISENMWIFMSLNSCASVCTCVRLLILLFLILLMTDYCLLCRFSSGSPLRFIFCAGEYYYQTNNFQKAHISLVGVLQYVILQMSVHACGNALHLVTNSANDESP